MALARLSRIDFKSESSARLAVMTLITLLTCFGSTAYAEIPCNGFDYQGDQQNVRVVTRFQRLYHVNPEGGYYHYVLDAAQQDQSNNDGFVVEGDSPFGAFDINVSTNTEPYTVAVTIQASNAANSPVIFRACDAAEFHLDVPTLANTPLPTANLPDVLVHLRAMAESSTTYQGNIGPTVPMPFRLGGVQIFPWGGTISEYDQAQGVTFNSHAVFLPVAPYFEYIRTRVNNNTATASQRESYNRLVALMTNADKRINRPGDGRDTLRLTYVEYLDALRPLIDQGAQGILGGLTEALLGVNNSWRDANVMATLPDSDYLKMGKMLAGSAMIYDACKNSAALGQLNVRNVFYSALHFMWGEAHFRVESQSLQRALDRIIELPMEKLCASVPLKKWIFLPGPNLLSVALGNDRPRTDFVRYFYWLAFQMQYRGMRSDGTYATPAGTPPRTSPFRCMTCTHRRPLNQGTMEAIIWPQTVPQLINGTGYRRVGTFSPIRLGDATTNTIDFKYMYEKMAFRGFEIIYAACRPLYRTATERVRPGAAVAYCKRTTDVMAQSSQEWRTPSYDELHDILTDPPKRAQVERLWGAPFAQNDCFVASNRVALGRYRNEFGGFCLDQALAPQPFTVFSPSIQAYMVPLCMFSWQSRAKYSEDDNFDATPQGDFPELL